MRIVNTIMVALRARRRNIGRSVQTTSNIINGLLEVLAIVSIGDPVFMQDA